MALYHISELYLYPIKSLGGIAVHSVVVEARGFQHDRRWMLTDEQGVFLTQRTFAEMAWLQVGFYPDGLVINHKKKDTPPLFIPFFQNTGKKIKVTIWDDICDAFLVSTEADHWFSEALNRKCHLVFMPDSTQRQIDLNYSSPGESVSFADGYPILIIGQESLNDLNTRLPLPVPIDRFRPSLVFTGGNPYAEDTWQQFAIKGSGFKGIKPCSRCVLTTIDQVTALKGLEPLHTLTTYRKKDNKIYFGQNVIPINPGGVIRVGDLIQIHQFTQGPFCDGSNSD